MTNIHTQPKSDYPMNRWFIGETLLVANMVSHS
jgi:hypothetical protein